MKIGDIEFTTTSEELSEIFEDLSSREDFDIDRIGPQSLIKAVLGVPQWGSEEASDTHALMSGLAIGAEIYRRRLAEKNGN